MDRHADWMWELAIHYEQMRRAYPDDRICIVFDIDGTILDMRFMVFHTLLAFERVHATEYFRGLRVDDVDVHENNIAEWLRAKRLPAPVQAEVLEWCAAHMWSREAVLAGAQPYRGVMSVIRWFQLQPDTVIALNTGRPEALRDLTLESLNAVARAYRVSFPSELLCMNSFGPGQHVQRAKVQGLRRLQGSGLRIAAVVDNEPANLIAMAEVDRDHEILFLHADTIFESQREDVPRSVAGRDYALGGLVQEAAIRGRVEFIWHGVNDRANLRQFLSSDVGWAECDVRLDPLDRLVLRHDSFDETPWTRSERPFLLEECLEAIRDHGRAIALDVKKGSCAVDRVLEVLARSNVSESKIAFMGAIDVLGADGVSKIRTSLPQAQISVPVGFLAPLVGAAPHLADQVLAELRRCGVTSVSLAWTTPGIRTLLDELEGRGWEVDIFGVEDLEAFLEAVLLLPRSVIADFNFPDWHYYGRGAGQKQAFHRYKLVREATSPLGAPSRP
jgi:hypothetical protein